MSPLEITAVVFYLASVLLTIKKNVWFWPTGIVAVSCYLFLFFREKLYADMALQLVYLAQSFYGWYFWYKTGLREDKRDIGELSGGKFLLSFLITGVLTVFTWYFLVNFTDGSLPFWDATATALSLMANFLLSRKIMQNWIYWIMADVVYIALFFYKELYLSSFIYFIFLFLAIGGYLKWKKELLPNKVSF